MKTPLSSRLLARALLIAAIFLLPGGLFAQFLPLYFTGYEPEEGFPPGPIGEEKGWVVERGAAQIDDREVFSGEQALRVSAGEPAGEVVRWFGRFAGQDEVYVDFFLKGAAGPFPFGSAGGIDGGSFALALVEESADTGVFYAYDGNGWRRIARAWTPLDGLSGMTGFERVTVRLDYGSGIWDFYLEGELAASGLAMAEGAAGEFSSFAVRGHPDRDVVLDDFYAGVSTPLSDPGEGTAEDRDEPIALSGAASGSDEEDGSSEGLSVQGPESETGLQANEWLPGAAPPGPGGGRPLPFFDDFEDWPQSGIHGRGGWEVAGGGQAQVRPEAALYGAQGLHLMSEERTSPAVAGVDVVGREYPVVWTEFYLRPARHARETPPELAEETAVGLYFDRAGRAVAWDGNGEGWVEFEIPRSTYTGRSLRSEHDSLHDPDDFSPFEPRPAINDWVRVTVRQDFSSQTWSLWLNSVKAVEELGFASEQESYRRFQLSGKGRDARTDNVYIGEAAPSGLDDDGDGLTNELEIALGLDPRNPDASDDGMWNADKLLWGLDPFADGGYLRPVEGNAAFGTSARLDAVNSELFVGAGDEKELWVSARFRGRPGVLPEVASLEGPRSALIAVNHAGYIVAYDGVSEEWLNTRYRLEDGDEAVDLVIYLDYESGRWLLSLDGVLRLRDLGFRDADVRTLTRFAAGGGAEAASVLEDIELLLEEPPGLDYSGDGLTNEEKRALGLDVFATDTSGDGLPDWWLMEEGFDPLDGTLGGRDVFGYGLTLREEFLLGTDPNLRDTDGDGWSDFDEYLAGTDFLDTESFPDSAGLQQWSLLQAGSSAGLGPQAYVVDGEFRLLGGGNGVGEPEESFSLAHRRLTGNFEVVAHVGPVEDLELTTEYQRSRPVQVGLMARESLSDTAAYSAVFSGGASYGSRIRERAGAGTLNLAHGSFDDPSGTYVRLSRNGNRFRHYRSDDGLEWELVSDSVVEMGATVYVGMFVASGGDDFRIRGRLSQVQVVRESGESDWFSVGGENGPRFDSFAWIGEWDGSGDYDTAALRLRTPALEELEDGGLPVSGSVEVSGSDAVETVGEWVVSGDSMICMGRRGWIEFDLEVNQPDLYLIEIEGGEARRAGDRSSSFNLKIHFEDEYLDTRVLVGSYKEPGRIHAFTPWIPEGTHRVKILWDGARAGTSLKVDSLRLLAIDGPDSDGNGVKDWVEERISRQSATDPVWASIQPTTDNEQQTTENSNPILTYVSPLPLEGPDRYSSMMRIGREVIPAGSPQEALEIERAFVFHPRGEAGVHTARVSEPLGIPGDTDDARIGDQPHLLPADSAAWSDYLADSTPPVSFPAESGPGYRYRADVPLVPLQDNAITISWQNGVTEERRMARWIPYDTLSGGHMTLRAGDTLLLTAGEAATASESVVITVNGEVFETTAASPLAYTFTEPGEYAIEGTYRDSDGRSSTGTLHVTAQGFTFPENPIAMVNRYRNWRASAAESTLPAIQADPRLRMNVSHDPEPGFVEFYADDNDVKTFAARLGGDGPILDAVDLKGVRLFSSWETDVRVVGRLPDGSSLVEMMTILSPLPEDAEVHLQIFVGGVVFEDGTIEKVLTAEDFDELGQASVRFIKPPEALTSVCHRSYLYQNDTLVGVR